MQNAIAIESHDPELDKAKFTAVAELALKSYSLALPVVSIPPLPRVQGEPTLLTEVAAPAQAYNNSAELVGVMVGPFTDAAPTELAGTSVSKVCVPPVTENSSAKITG
jgi:hypothetical protein